MASINITQRDLIHIREVMDQFISEKSEEEVFYHFCFALLVPQTTHKSTMVVISNLKEKKFFDADIPKDEILEIVKPTRFYNNKTRYLLHLKENWNWIYDMTMALLDSTKVVREFLVEMVPGLGMKAASHLLRNLGKENVAIIDTHIMKHYGFAPPKNDREYLLLEEKMKEDAANNGLSVGELDIYLWKIYSNTDWENFIY